MKLAALYSATNELQNSCTAGIQQNYSDLKAFLQLNLSCSELQNRCVALCSACKRLGAVLQTLNCCQIATASCKITTKKVQLS